MTDADLTLRQARAWCTQFGAMYRDRRAWVVRCFEAGMSKTAIADRTGLGRQTVQRWIFEHELRAGLADAAAEVQPSPDALEAIQARTRNT